MANFKRNSRYANQKGLLTQNNKPFILLKQPIQLAADNTDTLITVTDDIKNRPDLISSKAYGTEEYWWIIYEYNNIYDPLFELKIGSILRIPTLQRVLQELQRLGV